MSIRARRVAALLPLLAWCFAAAQIAIPTFGTRGEVPPELTAAFSEELRAAVTAAGMAVTEGELVTAGIAGSLDPEFAILIAELDGVRYAVSGELSAVEEGAGGSPYVVNLIVVDRELGRASDLISRPLAPQRGAATARGLARTIMSFVRQAVALPQGDAGLFVSSQPGQADVFVDGVRVGSTSELDVLMLAPGRYALELRKEGFLPESRVVELGSGDTAFVHVLMSAVSGGSIQVVSEPAAEVFVDGLSHGFTPLTLGARPGVQTIRLEREGFRSVVASVPVRNYRVSRVELKLDPVREPLLYWNVDRPYLVYVNGVLQPGGYARDVQPGLIRVELRRGAELRSYPVVLPSRGVFELDLETGEVRPVDH